MASEAELHLKLKQRWVVTCRIEPLEDIHPGAGRGDISIAKPDLIVMRRTKDPFSMPIIPGSSLKGAFRAYLSRILNSLNRSMLDKYGFKITTEDLDKFERKFTKERNINEKLKQFKNIGTVDKLFGISGFASPIKFTDAIPSKNIDPKEVVRERQHIKIDINTDKTENLFTVESVMPNLTFEFKIIFDELDSKLMNDSNKLFKDHFIKALEKGINLFLGGFKSRGYGYVLVKAIKVDKYAPEDFFISGGES